MVEVSAGVKSSRWYVVVEARELTITFPLP